MKKLTTIIWGAALITAFSGCGGGGGGSSSSTSGSGGTSNSGSTTIQGVATPSSVSVVTAQNANTGG